MPIMAFIPTKMEVAPSPVLCLDSPSVHRKPFTVFGPVRAESVWRFAQLILQT